MPAYSLTAADSPEPEKSMKKIAVVKKRHLTLLLKENEYFVVMTTLKPMSPMLLLVATVRYSVDIVDNNCEMIVDAIC